MLIPNLPSLTILCIEQEELKWSNWFIGDGDCHCVRVSSSELTSSVSSCERGELPVTVTLSESHPQSPRVRGGAPGLGLGAIWLAPLPTRSHRSPAEPGVVTFLASDWLLGPVPGLWLVGRPLVTRPSLRESLLAAPVTLLHPATFIYIKNIFNSSNKLNSKVALICICPLLG